MFVNCLGLFSIDTSRTIKQKPLGPGGGGRIVDQLAELRVLYQERKLIEARELYEGQPGSRNSEWYWLGSLVYWHLGEYPLSRWAADYGLSLGARGEVRIKLLQRLGTTEERMGAFGEAIEHLEACLAELPAYPSLAAIMRGAVLNNLAHAYFTRNGSHESLRQAIHHYEQAAEEFRREGMREHLCQCLQSLAWALCDTGRADRAARAIDEAAPLCTTEQLRLHQTVVNAYQLLIAGDHLRSLGMLEPLMRFDDSNPAFIYALSVTAMASLALRDKDPGALNNASVLARQAIFSSLRPGVDPNCWTTANRVQKRVLEALKQQDRGA
jgi:tetratricopeptide (TPR) repeat protein